MEKGIITCIYKKKPELSIFGEFINDLTGLYYNQQSEFSKKSNVIIEYDSDKIIKEIFSDKIIKEIFEEKSKSKINICSDFDSPIPRYIEFIDINKLFFKYDKSSDIESFPKRYQKLFGENIMEITEKSIYNCAYFIYKINKTIGKTEIFGIRKLTHQNRYIFSFDSKYLTRNQFETIISIIFFN